MIVLQLLIIKKKGTFMKKWSIPLSSFLILLVSTAQLLCMETNDINHFRTSDGQLIALPSFFMRKSRPLADMHNDVTYFKKSREVQEQLSEKKSDDAVAQINFKAASLHNIVAIRAMQPLNPIEFKENLHKYLSELRNDNPMIAADTINAGIFFLPELFNLFLDHIITYIKERSLTEVVTEDKFYDGLVPLMQEHVRTRLNKKVQVSNRWNSIACEDEVSDFCISPDGKCLAIGFANGCLEVWQKKNQSLTWEKINRLKCDTKPVNVRFFSNKGVLTYSKFIVQSWDISDGTRIAKYKCDSPIITVTVDRNEGQFAVGCQNGYYVWDFYGGHCKRSFAELGSPVDFIHFLTKDTLITANKKSNRITIRRFDGDIAKKHDCFITDLQLSPDKKTFASASADKKIKIWDAATYECRELGAEKGGCCVHSLAYSSDSAKLLNIFSDKLLRVLDVHGNDLKEKSKTFGLRESVSSVSWLGLSLAISTGDKECCIWDTKRDGDGLLQKIKTESEAPKVSVSPHGNFFIILDNAKTLNIYPVAKKEIEEIQQSLNKLPFYKNIIVTKLLRLFKQNKKIALDMSDYNQIEQQIYHGEVQEGLRLIREITGYDFNGLKK